MPKPSNPTSSSRKIHPQEKHHGSTLLLEIKSGTPYNVIDDQTLFEIVANLESLPDTIRSVVLWGGNHFAVGADLKELNRKKKSDLLTDERRKNWQKIAAFEKPLIAAVNGLALGAGNELVLHADIVVSGENAKFGQPEINLGLIPGAGGTQRLIRTVGKSIAMEMILTGRTLSAQEAYQRGLVSTLCIDEMTLEQALKMAQKISQLSPLVIKTAKEKILRTFQTSLDQGLEEEYQAFCNLAESEDRKEGIQAFLEKRSPQFKGR